MRLRLSARDLAEIALEGVEEGVEEEGAKGCLCLRLNSTHVADAQQE